MVDDLEVAVTSALARTSPEGDRGQERLRMDVLAWERLVRGGFTAVGAPEAVGGAGGDLADAAVVMRVAARAAVALPLVEVLLGVNQVCAAAGLPLPAEPTTWFAGSPEAPVRAVRSDNLGWRFDGRATQVPWAGEVDRLVGVGVAPDGQLVAALLEASEVQTAPGRNLAGEPRDDVVLRGTTVPAERCAPVGEEVLTRVRTMMALGRALQITGALETVLDLTRKQAAEREQFGRPIGRFQAVQHHVAGLAGEVAAAAAIADAAVGSCVAGDGRLMVAAAKIRAGIAAGTAARHAHQVHGAIGYTREHPLQTFTRRLWSWRDEDGPDEWWAAELGGSAIAASPHGLWPYVVSVAEGAR